MLVRFRVVFREPLRQSGELGVHLVERHAIFQSGENGGRGIVRARVFAGNKREFIIERHPKFFRDRELKVLRHHPDDRGGFTVNPNGLADDVRFGAEIAPPNFVAEDRCLLRPRLVVVGREIAAHDRRHVDDPEKIFGDVGAGVTLRIVLVGDVDGRAVEITSHQAERILARLQVFVILSRRDEALPEIILLRRCLRVEQAYAHELLWMRERKSAQDKGVDDGELRGHAGDAERENEDGEETKRFFLEEDAQTDADILVNSVEDHIRNVFGM